MSLKRHHLWIGGGLAALALLVFLRSRRAGAGGLPAGAADPAPDDDPEFNPGAGSFGGGGASGSF